MMSKTVILRRLEEIVSKLEELRVAVEKLPEPEEGMSVDPLADQGGEETTPDQLRAVQFVDKQKLQPLVVRQFSFLS
jgi:hypothetical protein